jgi:hypothetical protein
MTLMKSNTKNQGIYMAKVNKVTVEGLSLIRDEPAVRPYMMTGD